MLITDPAQGEVPKLIADRGAKIVEVPFTDLAKSFPGGRPNMICLGLAATLIGLPLEPITDILSKVLKKKGQEAIDASVKGLEVGAEAAKGIVIDHQLPAQQSAGAERWSITGNEAAGLGALKGGVRFVAAYPITPATDVLEWMAPNLAKMGGTLIQAEDELASINMAIGGSFGGVPSMTATSGPGLALMAESLSLAVASETPVLVVDVQRGGPSTGIPTKSEQSDMNIAVYGLHGDAPHLVTAPLSISDCLFTAQWSVYLAEAMQAPVIMLSDQAAGQSRAIVDKPAELSFLGKRRLPDPKVLEEDGYEYARYADTADGISPMAVPGMAGGRYTADGLEHGPRGNPSTQADHHQSQLDKRLRKLTGFDYGNHWAEVGGAGDVAVVTWGSVTAPVREALDRLKEQGKDVRLIAVRLISPPQPEKMAAALDGVSKVLFVEQNHAGQFHHYFRAHYDLPESVVETKLFHRPGPLPIRPHEIEDQLAAWTA